MNTPRSIPNLYIDPNTPTYSRYSDSLDSNSLSRILSERLHQLSLYSNSPDVPMMEDGVMDTKYTLNEKEKTLRKFYRVEIATTIMTSLVIGYGLISQTSIFLGKDSTIAIALVTALYVSTSIVTYKSINLTIDVLPANFVVNKYTKTEYVKYITIHLGATIIGMAIALFTSLDYIGKKGKAELLIYLCSDDEFRFNSKDGFVITIISHLTVAIGDLSISQKITGINHHVVGSVRILFIYLAGVTFSMLSRINFFGAYKLTLTLLIAFSSTAVDKPNNFMNYISNALIDIIIQIFIYPVIGYYYVRFVTPKIITYMEYGT